MAVITMSSTVAKLVTQWQPSQMRFDTIERSDSTGSEAARLLAPPRESVSITWGENMTLAQASAVESFLRQLRGAVNVAALYDPVRSVPEGTLAGTLRVLGDLAAGSTSMTLAGNTNAGTFLTGDAFQIGTGAGTSHYAKATADATASGTGGTFSWTNAGAFTWTSFTWSDVGGITIAFEAPTRIAFTQGSAVTINQPKFYARMQGSPKWAYSTQAWHRAGGFAADFVETFSA